MEEKKSRVQKANGQGIQVLGTLTFRSISFSSSLVGVTPDSRFAVLQLVNQKL
jgi:hypothetical protein